jgi:hypothetical protein
VAEAGEEREGLSVCVCVCVCVNVKDTEFLQEVKFALEERGGEGERGGVCLYMCEDEHVEECLQATGECYVSGFGLGGCLGRGGSVCV